MRNSSLSFISILLVGALVCAVNGASGVDRSSGDTDTEDNPGIRLMTLQDLQDPKAPGFKDFMAPQEQPVANPKVDIKSTEIGRRYRTVLREGIKAGAKYAGHYAVVVWGCGSSCSMFAVVNIRTGRIITPQGINSVSGNHLDSSVDQFMADGNHGYWGYRYRSDSRLLVLVGMLNEDEKREGAYYFIMDNDVLKPVHETKINEQGNR